MVEAYGMTEGTHQISSNPLPPAHRRAGAVGFGSNVEIIILDEKGNELPPGIAGEVAIRGKNVTAGYLGNAQANRDAFVRGYLRTGDQGLMDVEGRLTLTGRLKELINRGGEKISPLEVDAVLLQHPAVAQAVSFSAPDAKYGEVVHAAVVLRVESDAESIRDFCRHYLAAFKVPERIHLVSDVPRTATGKIQRRHVAAMFGAS